MNARSQVFDLTIEGRQVDEAVASIFHTVLFHRCQGKYMYTGDAQYSIGTIGYTDVDCDFIDFTYVCCTSEGLLRTVKRAVNLFSEKLRSNESCGSGQISLEFFQKRKSRWLFQQECIPWEVWTVHLDLIKYENEDDRQMSRENVSDLLTEKVIYITELMNRSDYVPKTPSQSELDLIFDTSYPDVQPYLFKFDYSTAGSHTPSVTNTVKKIIKETFTLWRVMLASERSHRQQQQQQQSQQQQQQQQHEAKPQQQVSAELQPVYAKDTIVVAGGKYFNKGTSIMISQVSRVHRSSALSDDNVELQALQTTCMGERSSERKSILAVVGGIILLFLCQHNRLGSF